MYPFKTPAPLASLAPTAPLLPIAPPAPMAPPAPLAPGGEHILYYWKTAGEIISGLFTVLISVVWRRGVRRAEQWGNVFKTKGAF